MIQLLANKIKPKRNKVELRVDQNVIDFKKYSKEPISAEQLLKIDSHVETSEEIEELTNQQIFDLSMQRDEEEEGVKFL